MTWKSRGEFPSRSFVSQKWTLFLCLGSFCAGMLFTNRIWSIPEQNGLARPTAAETGKLDVVSEGCNSRILQEMEMRRENRDMYGEDFKGHNSIQALDKTISSLEMDLATARAVQESVRSGAPVSDDIRTNESSGKRKYLMVVGINTAFSSRKRRDSVRATWMPQGDKRKKLEEEKGIVMRFVIGHSATSGGILDRAIEAEDRKHGDFLRLNHVEGYLELSAKTKTYFATAVSLWDADFYVKVDDDVHVNIATLGETLVRHRSKQRIYIGCMKSGPVLSQKGVRYHEPEHWKFGESGNKYFRHATGQLYAISNDLATYISNNHNVLHKYANEDVSIGAWFIGLDVEHIDDRRLCCGTPPDCEWKAQAGNICVASFDWSCSGICRSIPLWFFVRGIFLCIDVVMDFETETDVGVVEKDPTLRYVRYDEMLGKGAFKTVYKAFDEVDGIEVAWNRICIEDVMQLPENLEKLYSEVHLLKSLKQENIIKLYSSWVDEKTRTINMITELFTSGSLRQYRKKHKNVDMKAIKNWARQILRGLCFLHSHNPPVIHRDLKCDNIFVNGNNGQVKIGDLGLAIIMQQPTARSVIGTPEFMAPELYEEEYNELVDIYSFGLCILEMITCEYPYSECKNPAQIYKKVTSGVKPAALAKVNDPEVRQFIEKCLVPASMRLPASELLKDPFLATGNTKIYHDTPLLLSPPIKSMNPPACEPHPMEIDSNLGHTSPGSSVEGIKETSQVSILDLQRKTENNEFRLRGEKNADRTISLTLRIADSDGGARNIHFPFYIDSDTTISIAEEMVEDLELKDDDVAVIAELIHNMIFELVPDWKPVCNNLSSGTDNLYRPSEAQNGGQLNCHWTLGSDGFDMKAMYEDLDQSQRDGDDQDKQESVTSDISAEYGVAIATDSGGVEPDCFILHECCKGSNGVNSNSDVRIYGQEDGNNNQSDNSISSYMSSKCSLDNDHLNGLQLELEAIETQYQQSFRELLKMREDAIENAKKRWISKKNTSDR